MDIWVAANLNPWVILLALWIPLAGWVLAVLGEDEAEN